MSTESDKEYCPICGDRTAAETDTCSSCGTDKNAVSEANHETVFCRSCGEKIRPGVDRCSHCDAPNSVVSTDGDEMGTAELRYYVQWTVSILFVLAMMGSITNPEGSLYSAIATTVSYALIAVILLPPVQSRIDKEYAFTRFGWHESIEEQPVTDGSKVCDTCQQPVTDGVHREYGKDFVIAGFRLDSATEGENTYCRACGSADHAIEDVEFTSSESVVTESEK